jgi:putative phosphoribosyl transferase
VKRFRDRVEAGRILAEALAQFADRDDVIVLALPRGGVPVAYEIARALHAPMDVLVVRKLGVPGREELAMGAIASGGIRIIDRDVVGSLGLSQRTVEAVADIAQQELERREHRYRADRPYPSLRGKTVILVDDGLATGSTMRAAALAIDAQNPTRLIIAVPVAPRETCDAMRDVADDVVCATTPDPFYAVGLWYENFGQTSDEEVRELLAHAQGAPTEGDASGGTGAYAATAIVERSVEIPADDVVLEGKLSLPRGARGVVLFAHGSGSSRHSPRNQLVAQQLQRSGLATLLMDLLSQREEEADLRTRALRFDIGLLARRLAVTIDWLQEQEETRDRPIGVFGASTGAGAALVAAAARPAAVHAVVSRGGRPDLAGSALRFVRAPTLLIVGSRDDAVIELNKQAMTEMRGTVKLEIVRGASHLFEEPGTLWRVAQLAREWFLRYLASTPLDTTISVESSRDIETRF